MKVLVPIDDSDCSWNAVHSLSKRAWHESVEFNIVTVVPFSPRPPYAMGSVDDQHKTQNMLKEYGQQLIDGTVAEVKKIVKHSQVSGKVLVGGITSSIVQEAEDWKPDLIVMGSHGRKGFQKLFLGSVAEEVSKQVNCKIEIIKEMDQVS